MSLRTGVRINQNHWTAVPLPSTVKLAIEQLAKNNAKELDIRNRNGRVIALDDDEGYISDKESTYDASDDNVNSDEPIIHNDDVSSNKIDKNNIIIDQNVVVENNENLQHFNIAGVPDDVIAVFPNDDDPRPDIEAAGIPDDGLVGVPIAGVND